MNIHSPYGRQRLGAEYKRLIDGDGDGKCREENGKWIPCPPGIGTGSLLRNVDGRLVADIEEDPSIDEIAGVPREFRKRMREKMADLGLSRGTFNRQLRKKMAKADPELIEQAKSWYPNVKKKTEELVDTLNERYGTKLSLEQGAAVVSMLSPAREFGKNARDAKKMMLAFAADEPFEIDADVMKEFIKRNSDAPEKIARLKAVLQQAENGKLRPSNFPDADIAVMAGVHPVFSTLANGTGFREVISALAVLRGGDIDSLLTGPKRRSFYSNIVNPDRDRVTIDTWMYRAMIPPRHKFIIKRKKEGAVSGTLAQLKEKYGKKAQDLLQTSPSMKNSTVPKGVGLYPEFAESVRTVAKEFGLSPAALQAIVWEVQREEAGYKRTSWESIERQFAL